jgi:hypothetical protein
MDDSSAVFLKRKVIRMQLNPDPVTTIPLKKIAQKLRGENQGQMLKNRARESTKIHMEFELFLTPSSGS